MSSAPSPTSDDSDNHGLSSTPTPYSHMHRSFSHASHQQWTPQHHHQGTSYFPSSSPSISQRPHPILMRSSSAHSARRGMRSASVSSATRGGDVLSEADEYDGDEERERERDRLGKAAVAQVDSGEIDDSPDDADNDSDRDDEDPITLKERQSLINVEHPFGLPIWKPALYKKSRSVTRYADQALHSVPSAQAERHLLPGNLFWLVVFGWWLSLVCFFVSGFLYIIPNGGRRYSSLVFGLGWYIAWPFGKYVEGAADDMDVEEDEEDDDEEDDGVDAEHSGSDAPTVRLNRANDEAHATVRGPPAGSQHVQNPSWNSGSTERTSLLHPEVHGLAPARSYGATPSNSSAPDLSKDDTKADILGKACFWITFVCIIAPLMLIVCLICWGLVVTIPMARLNWALIKHIFEQPDNIRFCSAPVEVIVSTPDGPASDSTDDTAVQPTYSVKTTRLTPGQVAPSGSPSSTVLLCTYRAVGWKYYKYTVGGVNIMFVNLMGVVFFCIFDWAVLLTWLEELEEEGRPVPAFLSIIASQGLIFTCGLLSVIPLSYFIGMAVASISAQSSIGMGAVINATFGSVIEILLYCLMLTQGKGKLVEGSLVGSILAGVLLMPGMSMVSSAFKRKEQKFNAKSAGVTSLMLIMAIIGALAPTMFYQTYGNFQLICTGCPTGPTTGNKPWICDQCYYQHLDPVADPFYQSTVKSLMYFCAVILVFSYLIGLWFSLRTHASQIWQNPQQLLQPGAELPLHHRQSLYQRLIPHSAQGHSHGQSGGYRTLRHRASNMTNATNDGVASRPQTPMTREGTGSGSGTNPNPSGPPSPVLPRRVSYAPPPALGSGAPNIGILPSTPGSSHGPIPPPPGFSPILESVGHAVKSAGLQPISLPESMSQDDFTRAVAVATVSALRHQQHVGVSPGRLQRAVSAVDPDGHSGGHDAPSWSRMTSASVLLGCTALYAVIAEILVDVVDVILSGSGLDEKFLGVTLFALVPNTTEFMNAISFALNGNIALSMEIGSAYALQVCLLQIPAMVAFSAWYAPEQMGRVAYTFSLIFPRWDVVVIILSMFLLTYTYIEAKSNYHRGSILILSYLVLASGFYFAPQNEEFEPEHGSYLSPSSSSSSSFTEFPHLTALQFARWYLFSWWR
ncbi:hypothetical protein D9758_007146 [Tetrapyrgos nigripes]|uniref:Uncharacterized protein n=1 Tax=Tetrapyrgos nigripes TaxID=182062 RepID=A0A8H5GDH5_9AGAR|nr:hypothetical protein D9758_007146 [Tetrapyrgos nigripes]